MAADMIIQVGWVGDSESAVDSPQFLPFFLQERQSLHSMLHAAGHFPFRKDIRYIEHLLLEKQEWLIWFDLHFTPEIELECKHGHFKGISWSPCEASMCSVSCNPAPPPKQQKNTVRFMCSKPCIDAEKFYKFLTFFCFHFRFHMIHHDSSRFQFFKTCISSHLQ